MKRKLKEIQEDSDSEEAVDKKTKSDDTNEVSMKEFDIKKFRHKLKTGNFFDDLKLFLKIASKTQDIIIDFILSGGKPLEIVEIIKSQEESSLEILSNLYSMLQHIVSNIINDDNQRLESTAQALKYLVNKNNASIMKMLSSSKFSDKITMLKILTIGVQIDREIGHEILKNITIFAKSSEKGDLSIFYEAAVTKGKSKSAEESIRKVFVNFIMSFLDRETDVVMSKKMLQKSTIFEFFMEGLPNDDYETIKDVLSCLTKNVLISPGFSKPEKLKIFTDNVIKHLLKIYEWKGPSKEEKENVLNLVHHFLILLLTNRKHGIAFKGLTENRQNLRQLQVLGIFKNVWMFEYPSLLAIEIIKACPDLMQSMLHRLVIGLPPRITPNWFMCANFTKKLISEIDPTSMSKLIATLEPKKISTNIIRFSISQFILQHVNENALIQQENLEIREISTSLLLIMLKQCCKYLEELEHMTSLKDFEKHRIRFDIINHLFTFFPHIDIILNSLYRSIIFSKRRASEENTRLVKSQLKNTLDILLLLIESFPSTIEKIPFVIDYLETLRQIYEYQLTSNDDNKNENLEIEMKIIKIILSLQPNIISPDTQMFERIFTTMIQVYCCNSEEDYRNDARVLLFRIIKNAQLFHSTSDLEISIWIESLKCVSRGILKESTNTFVKVLKSKQNINELKFKWANEKTTIKYDRAFFDLISQGNIKDDDVPSCSSQLSYALPVLLKMKPDKLNRIIEFVECLFMLYYHSFPDMKKSFVTLLKQEDLELNTTIVNYIKKKSLQAVDDLLIGCTELVYKDFHNSVIKECDFQLDVNDVEKYQFLILQAIFYATKLSNNGKLTDEKINFLTSQVKLFYNNFLKLEMQTKCSFKLNEDHVENTKVANKVFGYDHKPLSSTHLVSFIFEHYDLLLGGFDISEMNQMTKFVNILLDIFKKADQFDSKLKKYSIKIISQLKDISELNNSLLMIIEKFPFSSKQYIELINIILDKEMNETTFKLIGLCIEKLSEVKTSPLTSQQIEKIEKIYVHAVLNTTFDLSEFEQIFRSYFIIFPHSIADTSSKIFEIVFLDDVALTKSYIQLIMLLFDHKKDWGELFVKNGLKVKKEVLYPLLQIAFSNNIVTDEMLKPLYAEFKSGIIRAVEKPNKAAQIYRENIESSLLLVKFAMPLNECRDLASKKFKFESSSFFQIKILQAIFSKALEKEQNDQFFFNFINHWITLFGLAESKDLNGYLEIMTKWLEYFPTESETSTKINEESWKNFYTICLKMGLKSCMNSDMLVSLGKLITVLNVDAKQVENIFDMIFTHSNFFSLAFNMKSSNRKWKRNLFYLLNVLVQKNPGVAHEKHIPIYLSSYQATMLSCDQLILNLLRFYEICCGIDLHEYSPLLFGQAALVHFTSHEHDELKFVKNVALDKMDTVFFKLLNLFDKSTIENTLNNYPIKRRLSGIDIKDLDQFLVNDGDENVYDPGYFLPLFEMILTTSSFKFLSVAVKNELLALIPPALSCEDENMRLLAAHILLKCRENTEGKKKTKEIWVRFYDIIQKGLTDVREGTQPENKEEKHFPRPASISTRLLAEFCRIIPNKLHPIYNIVSNYLIIKEKFDFATIPELLVLYHSSEIQHEEHRLFLLNIINNGILDSLDFKLLNNTPFLKMMLSCYGCPISNRKIDLLILKIFDRVVVNCEKSQYLVDKYGLGLWIFQISVGAEAYEYDIIEMIISLIDHTFKNVKNNEQIRKILKQSLLVLFKKFTKTKLSAQSFLKFLIIMNETNSVANFDKDDCALLQDLANVFVPNQYMQQLLYLQNFPKASDYVKSVSIHSELTDVDETIKSVFIEVRKFIINCNKYSK